MEVVTAPDQLLGPHLATPVERASPGGAWAAGSEKTTTCWELSPSPLGDRKRRLAHPPGSRWAGEVGHANVRPPAEAMEGLPSHRPDMVSAP